MGYAKDDLQLYFCDHHANDLSDTLDEAGWSRFKTVEKV